MQRHSCKTRGWVLAVALSFGLVAASETGGVDPGKLSEMKALRKEAAHRTRRIIFDNDGNEPVYYCETATAEELLSKRTSPLVGSQVDTIFYCTWSSGFSYFTHNTKVGVVFDSTAEEPGKGPGSGFSKNKTRAFIDQGSDCLQIMVDWCRKNDIEVFWSMRMNDIHDAWGAWYSPHLFPPIKKEHPEWLMGSADKRPVNGGWTAVDYAQPEVRDLAFRFFEEVCNHYDVDGVQMDFFRHLTYFRKHAWGEPVGTEELDMMTDLLRRVRQMADEVAVRKGHPILISVRVPDSVELCRAVGIDIERWMKEDLIDLMTVSCYFRLNYWDVSVDLGHKYGVPVYPCLSETRMRDPEAAKVRGSLESYRARAVNVWQSGADGIYMFNFFNPTSPLWWELGSMETLEPLDKVYTTGARGTGNLEFWYKGGEQFVKRSLISPDRARPLLPGKTEQVDLVVGDDFGKTNPEIVLELRFRDLSKIEDVSVGVNEAALESGALDGNWLSVPVSVAVMKQGRNAFTVTLKEGVEGQPVLEDLLLRVRHSQ
ncbi:MAG TPA: family 10 glycosylhydrolase [Candidatus Hydrogenedentes bacterium]|nr:family 10 glycosylhydrolase [Candidatus Hydrogenedentota bacterium]HPG66920.1 family 10 glycosylhydrolase [Candidatus Hydrogenedentota bacterium]